MHNLRNINIRSYCFPGISFILCLFLSGCASDYMLRAKYGNKEDPCFSYRDPLIRSQEHFSESIVKGAVAGGILGGVTGFLFDKNDRERGALRGLIAGALSGAAVGYLNAKREQASTKSELRRAINQDASVEGTQVGELGQALRSLNTCRANQVAQIRADFQQEKLTRQQVRTEVALIRGAIRDDNNLVRSILQDVKERNAVYVESLAQVEGLTEKQVAGAAASYKPSVTGRVTGSNVLVAKTSARLRSKPGSDGDILTVLSPGQEVISYGKSNNSNWYSVQANGTQGYVYHNLLGKPGSKILSKSSSNVSIPVVDKSKRPKPKTDVEELLIETEDVNAEYDQQVASIDQDLDDLETMLI